MSTFIIKVWDRKDQARILKGFDNETPVYIYPKEYKAGKPVQEFEAPWKAMKAVDKIKKVEKWRHYDIVRII